MKELKANKTELSLLSLAHKANDLLDELLDNKYSSRHESHIAFNCKVYQWFDLDDVKSIIQNSKMTFTQIRTVLEEFDENRLNNIYNHALEDAAEGFKSWADGDSCDTPRYINKEMEKLSNPETCPYTDLRPILQRKRKQSTREKAVHAFFQNGYDTLEHLEHIDTKDFGCYGRSGGNYVIADSSTAQGYKDNVEHFLENAFAEHRDITKKEKDLTCIRVDDGCTREDWHDELSYHECYKEDLEAIIEYCNALLFVIKEGKEEVQALQNKEYYLELLTEEISNEIGSFTMTTNNETVEKWMNHQLRFFRTNASGYSFLRLDKKKSNIQTSQNISIELDKGLKLYKLLSRLDPNKHHSLKYSIGNFTTNSFGYDEKFKEPILRAGCHKIQWSFINKFYTQHLINK